jgi:hypothetical protein
MGCQFIPAKGVQGHWLFPPNAQLRSELYAQFTPESGAQGDRIFRIYSKNNKPLRYQISLNVVPSASNTKPATKNQ